MSFTAKAKGRELAYITRILNVFGIVDQTHMRRLFSYLSDEAYGKILMRLVREGLVYWPKGGTSLAASRLILGRTNTADSSMCFLAFIALKDKIDDFCAGEPPAIVTIKSSLAQCDVIPLNSQNTDLINRSADGMPEKVKRFLVTYDALLLSDIQRRFRNDYVMLIGENEDVVTYEL